MTGFPPPSDRPETAQSASRALVLALFRPVLFAFAAIGITIGVLLVLPHGASQVATAPPPPPPDTVAAEAALPAPEPAPQLNAQDFQGFQMGPPATQGQPQQQADAEPPASDRYELTLRLETGDTIEKMLADIDVPEADRKEIDEKLRALLKKQKLAVGETITLLMQTLGDQPDAPRVLSLSVRPQPEHEYVITRKDDGGYNAEHKTYKVSPRIVRVEGSRHGSLQQSGAAAGAPSGCRYPTS